MQFLIEMHTSIKGVASIPVNLLNQFQIFHNELKTSWEKIENHYFPYTLTDFSAIYLVTPGILNKFQMFHCLFHIIQNN